MQPALPKNSSAPRFSSAVIAWWFPRANWSSVSIYQGEFEFSNGQAEHREIDRAAVRHGRKAPSEQRAILGRSVEPREHRLANGIVAIAAGIRRRHGGSQTVIELVELWTDGSLGSGEAGDLRHFGGRHLRLRLCEDQDHWVVRREPRGSFWRRKNKTQ